MDIARDSRPGRVGPAARVLAGCALVLLLAGCGAQFLYNRLDTALHLYVSSQVSLEPPQSQSLKGALSGFLDWHRRSELPRYAGFAEQLAGEAGRPLGRARIDAARLEIETLWRDSVARAAPDAARWLADLDAQQREELFESLGDDDDELREEFCEGDAARRQKRREKSFVSAAEDWVGRLDDTQRALVRERLGRLAPTGCGWVEQRVAVRRELEALVGRSASTPGYPTEVTRLLLRPEERWDAGYRAQFDANREIVVSLLADLDATLDARQRQRLVAKLSGFARDFRELAGPAATSVAARGTGTPVRAGASRG
jgi:hypothetical protein